MSEGRRLLRVEREMTQALSELLIHGLKWPLPGFASVAKVDAAADMRSARVYVRVAGAPYDHQEAEKLLLKQRSHIQAAIAKRLQTRHCPVLTFVVGGVPESQVDEVEQLLANLKRNH